jgi:hypothetical protein
MLEAIVMSEESPKESPKYKFPSDIDRDHLHTEQPLDPMINRRMQMPNPLDPIGNIETEGRALRNLASGRIPMWVLLCGWATIGLIGFLTLGLTLQTLVSGGKDAIANNRLGDFFLLLLAIAPLFVIGGLIIIILYRATWRQR